MMKECQLDHRLACCAVVKRDDYRCRISGWRISDTGVPTTWKLRTSFLNQLTLSVKMIQRDVVCNATLPSTNALLQLFRSAGIWTILSMLTDMNIPTDLAGNCIHRLDNMEHNCHVLFDSLSLWLKPFEDMPHTYDVRFAKEEMKEGKQNPERVTFSTTTDLPLPHREYFALHSLCCEVAWMSGAAEYLMDMVKRMDDTRVLANDGSTADLLTKVLALAEVD